MMISRKRERYPSGANCFDEINITPFTDVLLVLLIIFVITGSAMVATGVELSRLALPTANQAEATEVNVLNVVVAQEGKVGLRLGEKVLSWNDVWALDIKVEVILSARANTPMERVVEVYDELARHGFHNVAWAPPSNMLLK